MIREVDTVESRALARGHALKPPFPAGQPRFFRYRNRAEETLGELMLFDKNISARQKSGVRILPHAICRV